MSASHSLVVEDLHVGYGKREVLEGIDLELLSGKITAIVGANASGKSTLLRAMARLLTPSSAINSRTSSAMKRK